ncbi:MAG TPA: hypothetical protein VF297_01620 [Pyrinomonadaceae bacterium]
MPTDDPPITNDNTSEDAPVRAESNPLKRQRAFLRQRYALLQPSDAPPPEAGLGSADIIFEPESESVSVADEGLTPTLPPTFQRSVMRAYRRRQQPGGDEQEAAPTLPGDSPFLLQDAPLPGPSNNWVPLGPSVLRQGQALNRPAVSGRVAGIAVAPGGLRVYVASANGGVWRSDDGGNNWHSTMDAWDLSPTTFKSDSLACGAIALDPKDPRRVYVGTGEGGAESYFGVGPLRSDDGGDEWKQEPVVPAEATLDGSGFYQLALDPADRERVVGATERGLYRREPDGNDGFHWAQKLSGNFTSVVATRGGNTTTFYAAQKSGRVFASNDGDKWDSVGTNFPASDTHRIALAAQPNNPNLVYALVSRPWPSFHLRGLWRFDRGDNRWREVADVPADLFGDDPTNPDSQGQGWYDIAIAVDPNNGNRLYLGGSARDVGGIWPSSIYSCLVTSSGSGAGLRYRMAASYIGPNVHADIHALVFTPGDSNRLWVGCDGGLFNTSNATAVAPTFTSRNVGLATLTMNFMSQHPTEEAVIFCGTQDNGTSRYTGEEVWLHSCWGDGGFVVINWNDPNKVLRTYTFGIMQRTSDGGQGYDSWDADASLPPAHRERSEFYAPLVGAPYNPDAPAEADIVAFGGIRLWLTTTFGKPWKSLPTNDTGVDDSQSADALPQPGPDGWPHTFRSLAFATTRRIYAGTNFGHVYRYDKQGTKWKMTAIHAAPLPATAPVTGIAVDASDQTGGSIYVSLGGHGDYRHIWHFDGQQWEHRGGPANNEDERLLDVQHNAVVVDPENPEHLYAGADVGVWRSTDGGRTWSPFSFGLPDSAVLDLQLHPTRRLLRAATHGRGVFEYKLDTEVADMVELYVRDTQLDVGRRVSSLNVDDPTRPGQSVRLGQSPDIKVDAPGPSGGYRTPTNQINFYQFVDVLTDPVDKAATAAAEDGIVNNRVYVQVHNRGLTPADRVRVTLLLAKSAGGIPDLPAGFDAEVRAGNQINTAHWRTVGIQELNDVRVSAPKVAAFDLPSSLLPQPGELQGAGEHCLLVLLHAPDDEFGNNRRKVAELTPGERKAAYLDITVAPAEGIQPSMAALDLEENVKLSVTGKRRPSTGEEYIYVRALDERGEVLDAGAVKVELSAIDEAGAAREVRALKYNRGWRSFWLRADELPRVADNAARVMVIVSGQNRRARATLLVRFGNASQPERVEE